MDKYYNNIKVLIENNIIEVKKQEISVNNHTLMTYFNVGKLLVEAQGGETRAKYGNGLIKRYSNKLTLEYGKGYDYTNLSRMRDLYLCFQKVGTVCQQLSWSHYRRILPIKNDSKRNYYINLVIENRLSVRQLINEIKNNSYERLIGDKDNIELKYINDNSKQMTILDMIKDPILISIGNTKVDRLTEKALKCYILDNIEKILLELGVGFSFVGSEKKIKVGDSYRYIDLVFFNYKLNCFVLIELKINKLDIKDIGQLEFYVRYYNDEIKEDFHNTTIGIIVCKKNDKSISKYGDSNIYVSSYELVGDSK
ncbi:MAG: DUF1016 domain-containing protein [Firmicutes bacterium]|nr:DUF1016 domain-containing protein [Bacillota bacterium]